MPLTEAAGCSLMGATGSDDTGAAVAAAAAPAAAGVVAETAGTVWGG